MVCSQFSYNRLSAIGKLSTIPFIGSANKIAYRSSGRKPVLVPPILIENSAPTKIKIPYSIALNQSIIPATSSYTLSSGRTVTTVEVFELYVLLTVSSRYYWGDSESVAYTKPLAPNPVITSALGDEADSFTVTTVTNQVALDAATTTLIIAGRYTDAPTDALKALINKTIVDLRADGILAKGDCLYVRGVHENLLACQNWIKNEHNSTLVNNPSFTPKVGFQGDGSTSYINNNYNPKTQGIQYTLAAFGFLYAGTINGSASAKYIVGAHTTATNYLFVLSFRTTANELIYPNGTGTNAQVNQDGTDYIGCTRLSGNVQAYKNGSPSGINQALLTAADLVNLNIYELCGNVNGSAANHYNGNVIFSFYGAALNATEQLALYTRIAYFYANVGSTF
jgi:hypothetical protein